MAKATTKATTEDTIALIFGDNLPRQEGETSAQWQTRRTAHDDAIRHFIQVFDDQDAFLADTRNATAHAKQFGMGTPLFYLAWEGNIGGDDPGQKNVSIAFPETPIKYRTRSYGSFKNSPGNIVSNFQEWMIDSGNVVENLHPWINDEYRQKNQALIDAKQGEIDKRIAEQLESAGS